MDSSAEHALQDSVLARLTWRVVPFLFLLYIVAYLDRINVGFAALQMQEQLGFTDRIYGLGAGMFFAGYFFFQVPSNLVLHRVGARRWITLLMMIWGVISSSMILVRTPQGFYLLRFLLGAAEAGFFPGMILYLKTWFPEAARARAVALFMTAGPLSGVVGGPVSGVLLSLPHRGGMQGWQWLFLIEGLPAIVLGVVVLFSLTDHPRDARWLSQEQRTWLLTTLENEKGAQATQNEFDFAALLFDPRIWLLAVVYFGLNTGSYGISLWLPKLLKSASHESNLFIGVISAIPYVAAAITMVLVGQHSDRTGERRWHVAISAWVGAAGLMLAAYANSLPVTVIALSLGLMTVNSMTGPFWALPAKFLQGTAAAAGIAFINSLGNLGGFFGPYVIGSMSAATGTFRGGLLIASATLALAGCLPPLVRAKAA